MIDLCLTQLPNPALSNPTMYYSLGLLYIASSVEKAGFSVEVHDLREGYKPFPEAKFYGFSATTPEIAYAKKFARTVSGKTIVGGAHASLLPQDCLGSFDYVVVGEGEDAILDILNKQSPYNILVGNRIRDLDRIPFPAWDKITDPFSDTLFPGEKYGKGDRAATMITSRGCPYNCNFCANIFNNPVVFRGVDNIIEELQELISRGVRYFRFEDDNVAIHPKFEELANRLSELDIHYKCHIRGDLVTEKRARLLKMSGCEECGMGLESADDRVLKINNKKETVDDNKNGLRLLREAGIRTKTYWVMGLPGETDETLELNKQFVREMKPDKWTVSTFTPYPGCPVFKNPAKFNIEIIDPDYMHWWNFCEETNRYNHLLNGQTMEQMWDRYTNFDNWLRAEEWK